MVQCMVLELHQEEFRQCIHADTQPMFPGGIMHSIGIKILLNQLKKQTLFVHIDWRFSKSDVLDTFQSKIFIPSPSDFLHRKYLVGTFLTFGEVNPFHQQSLQRLDVVSKMFESNIVLPLPSLRDFCILSFSDHCKGQKEALGRQRVPHRWH